jgi:hypothetical protein
MILMAERAKFQFRMRDLLWAVSLAAISVALGLAWWRYVRTAKQHNEALLFILYFGSGAFFGAAVGVLLRKWLVGAVVGALLAGLLFTVFDGLAIESGQMYDGGIKEELEKLRTNKNDERLPIRSRNGKEPDVR